MDIRLGLLGKNISHSKSQKMYESIFNRKIYYKHFDYSSDLEIPTLNKLFEEVDGLSITAPYKRHFLQECILEEHVKRIGAINCIKLDNDKFYGTNTDFSAIKEILNTNNFLDKEIVILGSGAMAQMLIYLFEVSQSTFKIISRKKDFPIEYIDTTIFSKNLLIINCCARAFNFEGKVRKSTIFWDLNYDHQNNKEYLSKRCRYMDGLELLGLQAKHAVSFWSLNQS